MEMSQGFNSFRMTPLASLQLRRSRGAAIYIHPDEVASDPDLPLAEKRALLASWISDARAVENSPPCGASIAVLSSKLMRSYERSFCSMMSRQPVERIANGCHFRAAGVA
jgi:hypothetical protein